MDDASTDIPPDEPFRRRPGDDVVEPLFGALAADEPPPPPGFWARCWRWLCRVLGVRGGAG